MDEPSLRMDDDADLAFDRGSETKHELWDGEVYAMTGASLAHNRIVRNLVRHLGNALDGSGCELALDRAFDRGDKFIAYRTIPGLDEIVFVSQHERRVECYTRQADDSWVLREYRDDGAVVLVALSGTLALRLIYEGVAFEGA